MTERYDPKRDPDLAQAIAVTDGLDGKPYDRMAACFRLVRKRKMEGST